MVDKLDNLALPPSIDRTRLSDDEIQFAKDQYMARLKRDDIPVAHDLNAFFRLVHFALQSKQSVEGIPSDKRLLFVEEDPPENIDTEAITFELYRRDNGSFSRGAPGQGTVKERTHHLRRIEPHPDHPGEELLTFGKFYDNWIDFNIYARSNKTARERLLWFEGMMGSYAWYFELFGFKVSYEGTSKRERVEIDGRKITKYPVRYFVRTDDVYHVGYQELKDVAIAVMAS